MISSLSAASGFTAPAIDYHAFAHNRLSPVISNPAGKFLLFRVGDALASRNIHAAIYDSLRLCKDL